MLILIYIGTLLLFGSTWLAVKIGLETIPPFTSAVVRFALAFIVFAVAVRLWRYCLPQVEGIRRKVFVAGFLMYGLNFFFIYLGQQWISSSLAAVLFATMPFFTAIFAHYLLPNEKLIPRTIIGMLIGFLGTALLFAQDLTLDQSVLGMLFLILSSAACSLATVLIKRDLDQIDAVRLSILQIPPGLALLLPAMLVMERPIDLDFTVGGWLSIGYLAIFGTGLAFIGWYYLLKRTTAVFLSLMTFLEPLVAAALGYLFLAERFTPMMIAGGALILGGILIATLKVRPARS